MYEGGAFDHNRRRWGEAVPKLVTKRAVRVTRQALAAAAVGLAALATMPARAQESHGLAGFLSRLAPQPFPARPPLAALALPVVVPAPAPPPPEVPTATAPPPAAAARPAGPAPRADALPKVRPQPGPPRREPPRPVPAKARTKPPVAQAPPAPRTPLKAKDPSQVANPVPGLLGDRTLRPGDLAMFPDALRVFTGRPGAVHALSDFAPLARSGSALPSPVRRLAAGLRPGWNGAWSLAGLQAGGRAAPAGPAPDWPLGPALASGPGPKPAAPAVAEAPDEPGPRVVSPDASGRSGAPVPAAAPPRLRGCPGGAPTGEASPRKDAFACAVARDREEAEAPAETTLAQLVARAAPGD